MYIRVSKQIDKIKIKRYTNVLLPPEYELLLLTIDNDRVSIMLDDYELRELLAIIIKALELERDELIDMYEYIMSGDDD